MKTDVERNRWALSWMLSMYPAFVSKHFQDYNQATEEMPNQNTQNINGDECEHKHAPKFPVVQLLPN